MKLKLGTRGSDLAMTQSRWAAAELDRSGVETEFVIISTSGDRSAAPTFGAIGPQGVFVREIEQALLSGQIDLAVHSFKDLPTASPAGLVVAAVPPRRDPADWLLMGKRGQSPLPETTGQSPVPAPNRERALTPLDTEPNRERALTPLDSLPQGARIGTASARRQSWLRHFRPDLEIASLRGNVPTRLRRLADGDFDAILLAGAGIERLEESSDVLEAPLAKIERERLDPEHFVPAPAQGALALQCRADDDAVRAALQILDHEPTRIAVELERRALALAEGGCDAAFGAYARPAADGVALTIMIERDGRIELATVAGSTDANLENEAMQALAVQSGDEA